ARLAEAQGGDPVPAGDAKKYERLRAELHGLMLGIRFNNARIEELTERLYAMNKEIIALEGRMLRLAMSCGVSRETFLRDWQGCELDGRWLERISAKPEWRSFAKKHPDEIAAGRDRIREICMTAGLPL